MDTSRLERFAKYARRYLMEQVEKKLIQVLIYTDGKASEQRRVSPSQVNALEAEIERVCGIQIAAGTEKLDTKPLQPLIEQVAYIWFNRFCALRYMDVSGFNIVNVVSPLPGRFQPEILEDAKAGHIDERLVPSQYRNRVFDLLSGKEAHPDPQSEAYRILFRAVCNHYADIMPFLFEQIEDWKELLMPDDLLSGNSILSYTREAMVPGVSKSVEVIGWLYQYYISEKKDEVFASVKKRKRIQSKDIPAVTQLFTPHWIVKYMVQNSLGRLWLESHPASSLKDKMEYYVPAETDSPQAEAGESIKIHSPEDIKFCDPCCGSGHILTYAFDLLFDIYSEEGYDPIAIPRLIIENNLFGIEIDERASELAAFALAMKAREKDRQWFSRGINPQICLLKNIHFSPEELEPYLDRTGPDIFSYNFERMFSQFEDAKTFGSLIVPFEQDLEEVHKLLNAKDYGGDVFLAPTHKKMLKLVEQADFLSTKYQVVVTNPPYLGTSGFGKEKDKWFRQLYPNSRRDFFAMFMERCLSLSLKKGFVGMINMQSWMFLSSYEKLRKHLIQSCEFITMAHLGPHAFDSIGGAVVSTTSFIIKNKKPDLKQGIYIRLVEGNSEEEKRNLFLEAISNPGSSILYRYSSSSFSKIYGSPFAYWIKLPKIRHAKNLGRVYISGGRMKSHGNEKYVRCFWEINKDHDRWVLYCNGGDNRKYYGNETEVLDWSKEAQNHYKQFGGMVNRKFLFKAGITWSLVGMSRVGFRIKNISSLYSSGSPTIYTEDLSFSYETLGFLNSPISDYYLRALNPTLNTTVSDVLKIPYADVSSPKTAMRVRFCIEISLWDWDSYETSWDFQQLPLLGLRCEGLGVREAYAKLREEWIENTLKMQDMEEENNRIFIEAYGLEEELTPEVPLREITLTCNPYYRYNKDAPMLPPEYQKQGPSIASPMPPEEASGNLKEVFGLSLSWYSEGRQFPLQKDLEDRLLADTMRELISYAVGCMFGRYSLDEPGLILANQGESLEDYLKKVPTPSFLPNRDNVIPILEEEWFADDIVNRFHAFLKITFGSDLFSQNLSYIENAIGKDIRTYFIRDFYNDHVKRYKKRPIYWLFSSPNGSFNALIYMHRYTVDTASIVLSNYLREYVFKLKNKLPELSKIEESEDSTQREKIRARKSIDKIGKTISELEYWERDSLFPTAAQKISIDLDDGVKVNYAKFSYVLKRIPGLA